MFKRKPQDPQHCWHQTHHSDERNAYKCCHCGRDRTRLARQATASGHGPHYPSTAWEWYTVEGEFPCVRAGETVFEWAEQFTEPCSHPKRVDRVIEVNGYYDPIVEVCVVCDDVRRTARMRRTI